MKRTELYLSVLLVPVDFFMLLAAGMAAYSLRFGGAVSGLRPALYDLSFRDYFPALLLTAGAFLGIFALTGLYAIRGTRRFLDEFTGIFLGCSTGVMALIVLFFFSREFFSSRFIIVTGWMLAVVAVTIGRRGVRAIQRMLLQRHIGAYAAAVFGSGPGAQHLVATMTQQPQLGYHVIGVFPDVDQGSLQLLAERVRTRSLDIIIQADPALSKEQTLQLLDFANDHHLTFKYVADLFETQASNIAVETVGGIPVIEIRRTRLDGWGRVLKRAFDILFAGVALIVLSPFLALTALLIQLDTPGSALVRLQRVGQSGDVFTLYKFRSMVHNAHALKQHLMQYNERSGPLFKMRNDPRVTRIGRLLRRTSIDELPQLWNVLRGDMSIVGPRPHEPEEVARYERHHRQLMTVKPGITGLAQISGRSNLEFEEEARLDIYYIEHWSPLLDLSILSKTPGVVLRMKSAV